MWCISHVMIHVMVCIILCHHTMSQCHYVCRIMFHTLSLCLLQCHYVCCTICIVLCHDACHTVIMYVTPYVSYCACVMISVIVYDIYVCPTLFHCRVYHCLGGDGACRVTGQDLLPFVWGSMLCLPVCNALLPHSSS